jgi:hypothetical protein
MNQNLILFLAFLGSVIMFAKIQLHKYIDSKNGYYEKSSLPFRTNPMLIIPYYQKVKREYIKYKMVCNILWAISIIVFSLVIGLK